MVEEVVPVPAPRRRGRPRSERAHAAILLAAAQLVQAIGLRRVSMDAVAERAGVSKATIYRWWSSKGDLALDAFLAEVVTSIGPTPDTGSLAGDLRAYVRATARLYGGTPGGRAMAAIVSELQGDEVLARRFRIRVVEPLRRQSRVIFEQALARGEIDAATDTTLVLDALFGAIHHRLLLGVAPLDERFADQLVELLTRGVAGART